jgi:Tfp pilus assembly protein PilE
MRQRGFGTVELVIAAVILGLLVSAAVVAHHWHAAAIAAARAAGADEERLKWEARERVQQQAYAAEIERLRRASDAELAKLQGDLATAQGKFMASRKEHEHEKATNDAFQRDLRAGRIVLVDPGGTPAGQAGGGNGCPGAATAPGGDGAHEPGACRLSGELAAFLFSEADRADGLIEDLVERLTLAQDVVTAYYRIAQACRAQGASP